MSRNTVADIDLLAIQHNFAIVKQYCPDQQVIAMVKADAYGHGAVAVAQALTQADAFGVACVDEAVSLRKAGISQPIVLFSGFHSAAELHDVFDFALTPVVHAMWQVDMLVRYQPSTTTDVWLMLDSGMHRGGFSTDSIITARDCLDRLSGIDRIGLMSHFACADEPNHWLNEYQWRVFQDIASQNQWNRLSLANSATIVSRADVVSATHWVRPGIMLYGISPMSDVMFECHLRPAMTLSSQVIAVNPVKAGATVGYGASWRARHDGQVALVPIGYGDGYPRDAKMASVLIQGRQCPIVGRVSMDLMTVDTSGLENVAVGDKVILWGDDLPIREIAGDLDRFYYQLLTQVGDRVVKRYLQREYA